MKILHMDQLSREWFQAHVGVVSASHLDDVLDFTIERVLKNGEKRGGNPGASRKTYQRQKLAELLTAKYDEDSYVSKEMLAGQENEPLARTAYELQEGVMVEQIGFALHDSIPRFGCSPDGLVGDDGVLELKCPKAGTHLQWILDGVIPEEHIAQVRGELSVTGRAWADFATFCKDVPEPLRLMVIRITREQADLKPLEDAVRQFNAELDEKIERLRKIVGPFELPAQMQSSAAPRRSQLNEQLEASLYISESEIRAEVERMF